MSIIETQMRRDNTIMLNPFSPSQVSGTDEADHSHVTRAPVSDEYEYGKEDACRFLRAWQPNERGRE